jgi:hypothetical protein
MANHYITDAGAGAKNGTDWSNAWDNTPTSWIRGDTYYFADGTYTSRSMNTALSGVLYITLKKATDADHGTDTGWAGVAHDGVALWSTQWVFSTGYWIIDGSYRGDWDSGYGFQIMVPPVTSGYAAVNFSSGGCTHVTFKYVDISCTNNTPVSGGQDCFYMVSQGHHNFTLQYCYIHDCSRVLMYIRACDDVLFEYNLFARNNYTGSDHGEPIASGYGQDRFIIRYNRFTDIPGSSGVIVTPDSLSGSPYLNLDWEIYGNIVYQSAVTCHMSGFIYIINWQSSSGFKVYNNTIVDINSAIYTGVRFEVEHGGVTHTNNKVYNNLWYNCANATHVFNDGGTSEADYNWYYNTTHTAETHQQLGGGDPFVNIANYDYHLAAHTSPGKDLGAGYQTDVDSVTRSNWDRGAYEYYSGGGGGVGILVQSAAGSTNKRHK